MSNGLKIRKEGALDFLSLGALVHRLDPGIIPFRKATRCDIHVSAGGVRWFHSGGIFAALSPTTAEVIVEAMKAAKAAGAVTSFDLNYRTKLWNISGGHDRAVTLLDKIVKNVDVLVGNEEDLQLGL